MPFYEFEGKKPQVDEKTFVHPQAVLIGDVVIEAGCYIGAGAVLRGDLGGIFIGEGSNVQENCVLHTLPDGKVTLHPNSHIGHSSTLHGCELYPEVLVGMGSTIMDDVVIQSRCIIGSNSLILSEQQIPEDSLVAGSPAKVMKKLNPKQLEHLRWARSVYQELARRYLKSFSLIS